MIECDWLINNLSVDLELQSGCTVDSVRWLEVRLSKESLFSVTGSTFVIERRDVDGAMARLGKEFIKSSWNELSIFLLVAEVTLPGNGDSLDWLDKDNVAENA